MADDLIAQAHHLARLDIGRPKQVYLRRATSSSYYALFHELMWDSSSAMMPDNRLRHVLGRVFQHSDMRDVCKDFAKGKIPAAYRPVLNVVTPDLKSVAESFVDLQQKRHNADYNLAITLRRSEVIADIQQAEAAIGKWRGISDTFEAKTFSLALLVNRRAKV